MNVSHTWIHEEEKEQLKQLFSNLVNMLLSPCYNQLSYSRALSLTDASKDFF